MGYLGIVDLRGPPFAIKLYIRCYLLAIHLRRAEAQFFFKCLLEGGDIPVFAKYQWNDEPIISRAHLAIGTAIPLEESFFPSRHIGRSPTKLRPFVMEPGSLMMNVARREQTTFANRLRRLSNQNAIHDHISARGKVGGRKLVLSRDVRGKNIGLLLQPDLLAVLQVGDGDQSIVAGIKFDDFVLHRQVTFW